YLNGVIASLNCTVHSFGVQCQRRDSRLKCGVPEEPGNDLFGSSHLWNSFRTYKGSNFHTLDTSGLKLISNFDSIFDGHYSGFILETVPQKNIRHEKLLGHY